MVSGAKPEFLMIHGSWHGGWAFDEIAGPFAEQGYRVHAPCLLGLGSDAANNRPECGLMAHVDQLEALVTEHDMKKLVLVGHSYGGALINILEGRIADRLHAVVHLEGAIPEPGKCIMDTWPESRCGDTLEQVKTSGDGWRVSPPDPKDWGSFSEAQADWLRPQLTDQALLTYTEKMPSVRDEADVPHYYLISNDRDPQPYLPVIERFQSNKNWQIAETAGGHELMFTNKAAVLQTIEIAAQQGTLPASI